MTKTTTQKVMFKITVDCRPVNSGADYRVISYISSNNDVQRHMMWLQNNSMEVLNIRSEPCSRLDEHMFPFCGDFVHANEMMTFINAGGEHVEDSPTDTDTGCS